MLEPKKIQTIEVQELELTNKLIELVAEKGEAIGKYNFLPLDTIIVLDELSEDFPGLRWTLRKQRGDRYILTVVKSKHLEAWESKGEP